jgi:heptaprenyl diphosphate synthase
MTLLALVFLGFREALIVTGVRIFLGSIIGGTFLGPTFFLSFSGGLAAILAMALVYRKGAGPFSLIGVSVVGAATHILAITFSVYFVFIPQKAFLHLLPILLSLALVSGILTGIAGNILSNRLTEANVTFR